MNQTQKNPHEQLAEQFEAVLKTKFEAGGFIKPLVSGHGLVSVRSNGAGILVTVKKLAASEWIEKSFPRYHGMPVRVVEAPKKDPVEHTFLGSKVKRETNVVTARHGVFGVHLWRGIGAKPWSGRLTLEIGSHPSMVIPGGSEEGNKTLGAALRAMEKRARCFVRAAKFSLKPDSEVVPPVSKSE